MAKRLNQQRNVDVDFALIEEGDHMYNGHLVDLYKIVGHYVIDAMKKKSPQKKRRGRRKKNEMLENPDTLLLQETNDEILDNENDDFDDENDFDEGEE